MDYVDVLKTEAAKEFRQNRGAGEDNWKSRQRFCNELNETFEKYGKDGAPRNLEDQLEPYFNNILDCAISERTILSNSACRLIVNIPKILGRDMHPHIDRFLPVLIKLCAATKAVTAKASAACVTSIIEYSTYSPRLLWHVCQVFEDKATGPKIFATSWLQVIMKDYYRNMHPDKDYEAISRAIAAALEDADATVRTNSRATFWTFYRMHRSGAESIMERLNNHARTALQNDPNNPDKKSTGKAAKAPPRPGSALAELREQARKQKAQQEKAAQGRKVIQTATSMQDLSIDMREPPPPRKVEKPERREKPSTASPVESEKTQPLPDKAQFAKSAARPVAHKKSASTESEVAAKMGSSAARGLLSAPVRRPRIVATPMNTSQSSTSSRPSSRTGHAPFSREPPTDPGRPTSSSSLKSAPSISSPRLKPSSPKSKQPIHVPDGKENASLYSSSKARSSPPLPRTMHSSPPKRAVLATPKLAAAPLLEPAYLPLVQDKTAPPENFILQPQQTQLSPPRPSPARFPVIPQTSPSKKPATDYDLVSARRYLETGLRHLQAGTLDPLGFRKLKNILEQYSVELLDEESQYNLLYSELLGQLHRNDASENDTKQVAVNPSYNQQVVLQTIQLLIQQHPAWSVAWLNQTLSSTVLYRCTCPIDAHTPRRVIYAQNLVTTILEHAPSASSLIDSVTAAIHIGEEALLQQAQKLGQEPHAISVYGPYNPSSIQELDLKHSGDSPPAMNEMRKGVSDALTTHPASDLSKALPLLIEFGLGTLVTIFSRALAEGQVLQQSPHADDLGLLAAHCLNSYDYLIKKAVVPYCQTLYQLMGCDDNLFFQYFESESEINLLNYYLAAVRP